MQEGVNFIENTKESQPIQITSIIKKTPMLPIGRTLLTLEHC